MAHQLAVENEHVTADVIEISEYPEIANKYQVYGVPKVVINETVQFEGALPEPRFVAQVLTALSQ